MIDRSSEHILVKRFTKKPDLGAFEHDLSRVTLLPS